VRDVIESELEPPLLAARSMAANASRGADES